MHNIFISAGLESVVFI